jgi:carbonic anhydrase/acetyltransferase-like protein (isoleucine patch superfamily)
LLLTQKEGLDIHTPPSLVDLEGTSPRVAPEAWIAPTAWVIGDADIADHASVFYGAVIRADQDRITVGAGSNLQDLVVVHADPGFPVTIASGVSVGHGAILHGCTIERDCLVGMGAIILNGAVIGEGSLIAAGTLFLAGAHIPARSLVAGTPGKVRRELSDNELLANQANAKSYVQLARRYARA